MYSGTQPPNPICENLLKMAGLYQQAVQANKDWSESETSDYGTASPGVPFSTPVHSPASASTPKAATVFNFATPPPRFATQRFVTPEGCHAKAGQSSQSTVEQDMDRAVAELGAMILCAKPKRTVPYATYTCHICYAQGDHVIQDCPYKEQQHERRAALTPYQGSKMCYGEYQCPKCKRKWRSTKSEADIGQACTKCKILTFAKKQMSLEFAEKRGLILPKMVGGPPAWRMGHWDAGANVASTAGSFPKVGLWK